jgi:hypothetical protein
VSDDRDTFHIADLVCPRCGSVVGDDRHDNLGDGMQIMCLVDLTKPHELDESYGAKTNAALKVLNGVLIETGRRLSVGQHSSIMRRVETTLDIALAEAATPSSSADKERT